jgi:ectoine hydroxylase-related dioxygenase (phytanoyl-CoA dioxygenase family)
VLPARAPAAHNESIAAHFSTWPETGSPAGYFSTPLNDDAVAFYRDNGFLVVEGAFDAGEVQALNDETLAICRGERGEFAGIEPVQSGETDQDVVRKYLCIHFPHKISTAMTAQIAHPSIVDSLTKLIGPNVKCMQSMLFVKASGKPGQAWHQDETHIPTRDRSLTAVWIAIDDTTVENGCLWVIPGSHRLGVLYPDREQDDPRFDCTREAYGFRYHEEDAVPVELSAGSALVFDGYLLHRSLPNTGRHGMRRALVNHYMSAESLLPWFRPADGEPMGTVDHRDVLLIAGDDPYEFKGIEDLMHPQVRPDGEGGCLR